MGGLEELGKRVSQGQMDPLLDRIGLLLVSRAQKSFRAQSRGGKGWLPRAAPNAAGLVRDFASGANPPARRFQSRPALIDTGTLRNSITYRKGKDFVEIGSPLSYAEVHNRGGETEPIPVTDTVKKNLRKWLAKRKNAIYRGRLQFLLAPELNSLRVTVPARTFLDFTEKDRQDIGTIFKEFMETL